MSGDPAISKLLTEGIHGRIRRPRCVVLSRDATRTRCPGTCRCRAKPARNGSGLDLKSQMRNP